MNKLGCGTVYDLSRAVQWAVDTGADILSNSWGDYSSLSLLKDSFDYAASSGVLSVAAAGNEGYSFPVYPAKYDSVMAVAATDHNDNKADFSNYGDLIDVCAPGVDILSTGITYIRLSGTSMATPHVAGLAALILSHHPHWTPADIKACISYTADPIDHLNPGYEGLLGSGCINASQALQMPLLTLEDIKGGFGITTKLSNNGYGSAVNVSWSIKTAGQFSPFHRWSGKIPQFPLGEEIQIRTSGFRIGLGKIMIIISADAPGVRPVEINAMGFALFYLVFAVQ